MRKFQLPGCKRAYFSVNQDTKKLEAMGHRQKARVCLPIESIKTTPDDQKKFEEMAVAHFGVDQRFTQFLELCETLYLKGYRPAKSSAS